MANVNPTELLSFMALVRGGAIGPIYGGIDFCIECKKKGLDIYVDENGNRTNMCNSCINNSQAVKYDG